MIQVIAVIPEPDFQLRLMFSDGTTRRFDMRPYLDLPVYRRLTNPDFFNLATVDYGTVVWPEDIDIAPETLYFHSQELPPHEVHDPS